MEQESVKKNVSSLFSKKKVNIDIINEVVDFISRGSSSFAKENHRLIPNSRELGELMLKTGTPSDMLRE